MADANGPPPDDAATMPALTIYNFPPQPPRWDRIGIAFLTFFCAWTTLILASMAVCLRHRGSVPALRVRCLPLTFAAVAFLHCYWILAWLVYPIGGTMPVVLAYDVQYFFMGVWFPLGIAVFHAGNLRFLRVARRQRRWMGQVREGRSGGGDKCDGGKTSWLCRLRNWGYMNRVMSLIGIGMVAQVLLTVGMWVACKKYHPTFGIPGTEIKGATLPEQMIDLGRGWEWWPSVLWQVIWTWIVAPYLIWKAWSIRDTMGWRTQTIGCCLANLHATPMFLIASYVPAFNTINAYFPPSQWIHLSIMIMEIFAVFVPLFEFIKYRHLTRKTAHLNAKWDTQSQISSTVGPASSSAVTASQTTPSIGSSTFLQQGKNYHHHHHRGASNPLSLAEKGGLDHHHLLFLQQNNDAHLLHLGDLEDEDEDRLLTMSALERVLAENPVPLQEFSALTDFSGENVAFIRRVAAWKQEWEELVTSGPAGRMQESERLELYNRAIDIYTDFISPVEAEFPLNLSSQHHASLLPVFKRALLATSAPSTPTSVSATPFDSCPASHSSTRDLYTGPVPEEFEVGLFDPAVGHVKYLVLTNTWPKFVRSRRRSSRRSQDTVGRESVGTEGSERTLVSRVSDAVWSLLKR